MATRRGGAAGTERVMAKLKKSIENENYYEAHQMYRTLYFRYIGQRKFEELENMLYEGSTLLFSHNQVESGLDLAKLYIETLKEGDFKPEDSKFVKICRLYDEIPRDNVDKASFLSTCLRWANGHPRLHQHIAYSLWKQGKYPESRQHFLHSCDGEGCGSMLVEFQSKKGFNSEMDLFIAQTVFQYLCLKKHLVAAVAFYAYTTGHPRPVRSFTVKENHIGSVVSEIIRYRQKMLTTLFNRIVKLFFGVPAPERPRGMFSGLFNSLLSAMNDDSSDEDLPGPSNNSIQLRGSRASQPPPPSRNLESADLD